MAVNIINLRLQDSESDTRRATVPFYVTPSLTIAEYQAFVATAAARLDAVSGAKIVAADMVLALTVPGGLKATPAAGSLNERGGLIGMDTVGQWPSSVRIPAILPTIMSGDSFSLTEPAIADFIDLLSAGVPPVFPHSREGDLFLGTGLYGNKSFRRK